MSIVGGVTAINGYGSTEVQTTPKSGAGLAFYHQIVLTQSTPLPVTVTNKQHVPVTITSLAAGSDFPFTTDCLNQGVTGILAAGATCTVQISFVPQAAGVRSGALTILETLDASPLVVSLSGTGIAGDPGVAVTVTPPAPCILPSHSEQFSAFVAGTSNQAVKWYVDNELNGSAASGTITAGGLYTAPGTTGTHVIAARSGVPHAYLRAAGVVKVTQTPNFQIYPYVAAVPVAGQQTFQPQSCGVPDDAPVTYTVDDILGGNGNVGTITAGGVYTAPAVAGRHIVRVSDQALGRTSGTVATVFSDIAVDFASRTNTQWPIAANLFGTGRNEILRTTADREVLAQGGLTTARLYASIPYVYATPTPDWTKVDPTIASLQAAGLKPLLQLALTPPWLQPDPNPCGAGSQTVAPTDLKQWAQIAAAYVAHMDAAFPGFVQDYEIWNEPNAGGLCGAPALPTYMQLYAYAGAAMRQQAAKDGVTIRIGGPVLSSFDAEWLTSLLNSPSTAPYVDFVSYHQYLFGDKAMEVKWDTYNGNASLYQQTQDPNFGPANYYNKVLALVKEGRQPLGANTPIYVTEFNTNWAFYQDCCRNDPTYAPLWSSLYISDLLNSVYTGTTTLPQKLVYFASSDYPYFCMIGVQDANMDCLYSTGSTAVPYPQYYTYQLLGSTAYLGLVNGGNMAKSVSPPSGGGGIVTTGFTTSTQDAVLITNPTSTAYSHIPVVLENVGYSSPLATLYQIVGGARINSSSIPLTANGSGYTTTIDVPAYSVQAISVKGQQ